MSVNSSRPQRETNSISTAHDYEGNRQFLRSLTDGLTPDPPMTVAEWADTYRILSGRAAAEAGKYRTSRTPYMREIMESLSPSSPIERVVFMKAAQTGATEAGNNFIGFIIHQAPGPILAVQPTVELAKRNSQQRIDPLIEDSAELRKIVAPARSRDSGNTVLAKRFPGGQLVLTGANSATGLEVHAGALRVPRRGRCLSRRRRWRRRSDCTCRSPHRHLRPPQEAVPGVDAHHQGLCRGSNANTRPPTSGATSCRARIAEQCSGCSSSGCAGTRAGPRRPPTSVMPARQPITEAAKTEMLAKGEWRATAEGSNPRTRGYHLSGLYSPVGWTSWADIARSWDEAQHNDAALKTAKNVLLGETWMESGEAPDWQRLYDRREQWKAGTVPAGGFFLTAGADVQKDRIEIDVWAWGRGLESWLIDHVVIEGGPSDPACWHKLTRPLSQTWAHASGQHMTIARLAIDTGFETSAVYAWSRAVGFAQVAPVKGVEGFNRASPVTGPTFVDATIAGKRLRRGARLWTVATSTFKAETYRFLRQDRPTREELEAGAVFPPGTIHLPDWADGEWLKQLTAEQLVTVKTKRGFQRLEWQKLRERNEALDTRVYARAAAWIAGADRWSEARWQELERQLAVDIEGPASPAPVKSSARPSAQRRTVRSSYMG